MGIESARRLVERLDRQGVLGDYSTGNDEEFDEIIKKWSPGKPKDLSAEDQKRIKELKEKPGYQKEKGPLAIKAEYALTELINDGFLGEGSIADIVNEADDILSGADISVAVFDPTSLEEKNLLFLLDVTISEDKKVLEDKVFSELSRLKRGERTRLKHAGKNFQDPLNRFVVALPRRAVKEMADFAVGRKTPFKKRETSEEVFDQILYQAAVQIKFVLKNFRFPGWPRFSRIDDFKELAEAVEKDWPAIRNHLIEGKPESLNDLADNHKIILYFLKQKESLAKEKGALVLLHSAPNVSFMTSFDPDEIMKRAA